MRHALLSLLLLAACASTRSGEAQLDLIIEHGRVYDGTGSPWFAGDVGIRGDRIAAVGDLGKVRAARRIDAKGSAVAPGFIDLLGQSEFLLLIDNRVESKIRQGITSEITGEGSSIAPLDDALVKEWLGPLMERFGVAVDWRDLDGYYRRFESSGSAINLGTLVGAANLRAMIVGQRDVPPTAEQLSRMEALAERAFEQGALGLSTALIYPPGSYAKTDELVALAKVAARHGGIYASHIRGEADNAAAALSEAIEIGRRAKVPVEIWHLKVAGRANWGKLKDQLARIEAARAEGVDVAANMYPYDAAMNGLDANVPDWAHDGGIDAMIARFHDPAQRARIKGELWHGGLGDETPDGILLMSSPNTALKRYMGRRLSEAAREMGKSPEDALLDLVEADRANLQVARFVMNEDDVRLGWKQPWVALGTDSGGQAVDGPLAGELTHPRAFGSAARLLGRYARDDNLMTLEEAVRRLSSLPAQRLGLWDRGLLRPGMAADVVVFNPALVRDAATYQEPLRYSEGFSHVLVNGKLVLDDGVFTKERPGRPLRRSK